MKKITKFIFTMFIVVGIGFIVKGLLFQGNIQEDLKKQIVEIDASLTLLDSSVLEEKTKIDELNAIIEKHNDVIGEYNEEIETLEETKLKVNDLLSMYDAGTDELAFMQVRDDEKLLDNNSLQKKEGSKKSSSIIPLSLITTIQGLSK